MVTWKGIDLNNKGIIVERTPTVPKGKKNIEIIEVEGRSGFLTIDNNTYSSFVVQVECHFDPQKFDIDEIKSFLDGVGAVSFDGEREYIAVIQNSISFEKVLRFKSFVIEFLCNPIAEEKTEHEVIVTQTDYTLSISDANVEMYPKLEITGTGDLSITINNKTFNILDADGTYYLDSKLKVITHNNLNAASSMQNDFPTLIPGENNISYLGNISSFKIKYRKAFL